jgi:hypothetical protein
MMSVAARSPLVDFPTLYARADAAGKAAAEAHTPAPMIVQDPRMRSAWIEPGGLCGFAWVTFASNTPFGRWAKANKKAKPAYPKGLMVWVSDYGQSMERKACYARAFADTLNAEGVQASWDSRAD